MRPWVPVLTDRDARTARNVARQIAVEIDDETTTDDATLIGYSARALLYLYSSLASGDRRHQALADRYRALALAGAETTPLADRLFDGFVGIAWMNEHIRRALGDRDLDDSDDLDDTLAAVVRGGGGRGYELMAGWIGYGVYAFERTARTMKPGTCLSAILDRLAATAEHHDNGVTWHTPIELITPPFRSRYPHGFYNLGIAHGVPGIAAFLARVVDSGFDDPRAATLLERTVRWILAQRLSDSEPTAFPFAVIPGQPPTPSRCAWCYGGPGVALTLLLAARALKHAEWERVAVDIARRSVTAPYEHTRVDEAGLCHGAAGVAQMCLRLHWMTGDVVFANAARTWLCRLLARCRSERDRPEWYRDSSLLGRCGVALTLLSATSEVAPDWDRVLLIST